VHGLIVGPTPKPSFFLFKITRFSKNDFPVLYFPVTAITATGSYIFFKKILASSLTQYLSDKKNYKQFV